MLALAAIKPRRDKTNQHETMKFSNSAAAIGAAATVIFPHYQRVDAFIAQHLPSCSSFPSQRPSAQTAYAKKKSGGGFGVGGGFGSGGGTSAPSKKKAAKKRKRSDMESLLASSKQETKSSDNNAADEPQLDRFGLPIPTEDDVFPPLPADTELISVKEDEAITMEDIRTAMKDHVQFNFDLFDDATCEEKNPANGAAPMKLRLLHRSPPVLAIDNFFTDEECDEYIALSSQDETNGDGALMVDSKTFSLSLATRTSTTWFLHYRQVPTLLAKTSRLLDNLPIERIEEPQLVRYKTGEQFSYHYDALPDEELDRNGGNRVATLLVYLRTIDENRGGATEFRDLRDGSGNTLSMRPTKGSALLFFPTFANGRADDRTLHKGEIAVDEKMIGQIWVHQGKYNPAVPEGNSHLLALDAVAEKRREFGYEIGA